ncbi:hypothetical protein B0T25DRAFT_582452 [Lasiosphaeria hispida]|uniref:Uncharacterized protein n=1 Tax=Lasiosphaeria hispida TaxID=260671 RepID=A0AAJ0HEV8_9PEZI|nr:hypothetical protein B0T25DRAFT_582452 [Lasiosphaeria hispida]
MLDRRELKSTIPVLRGEDNIERWQGDLLRHLEWDDLEKYIQKDIDTPIEDDAEARKEWKRDRIQVCCMINDSLTDPAIKHLLKANGHQTMANDPKKLYDLMVRCVTKTTKSSLFRIVKEYNNIKHKSFATLLNFITKHQALKDKVDQALKLQDTKYADLLHLTALINSIKDSYPTKYMLWKDKFNSNNLTYQTLSSLLMDKANTKAMIPAFANIPSKANLTKEKK